MKRKVRKRQWKSLKNSLLRPIKFQVLLQKTVHPIWVSYIPSNTFFLFASHPSLFLSSNHYLINPPFCQLTHWTTFCTQLLTFPVSKSPKQKTSNHHQLTYQTKAHEWTFYCQTISKHSVWSHNHRSSWCTRCVSAVLKQHIQWLQICIGLSSPLS